MLRAIIAAMLLGTLLTGTGVAEPSADALRGWRDWATGAVDQPPQGIEPFSALAERLRESIADRRTDGPDLEALDRDAGLERAANAFAIDLLRRDFMTHESPEGLAPQDRMALLARRFGGVTGENIAEHEGLSLDQLRSQVGPLALKLADGFMASPGHRENILRADYTHEAIAAYVQGERLVVVHVFGARRLLLEEPVDFEQSAGGSLDLALADGDAPAAYAYRAHGQPLDDVVVLEPSSDEIAVDPGLFQLMLMFPGDEPNSFEVADGPWIEVQ